MKDFITDPIPNQPYSTAMNTNSLHDYGYSMLPVLVSMLRETSLEQSNLAAFLNCANEEVSNLLLSLEYRRQSLYSSPHPPKHHIFTKSCLDCERRWLECAQSALEYLARFKKTKNTYLLGFSMRDFQAGERHFDQLLKLRKNSYIAPIYRK